MNEAIAKQEELTALVLLLADGLMGKLLVQLVLLVSSAGAFLILLFLHRKGGCAQAVISGYGRGPVDSPPMGRNSSGSYPSHRGSSRGHQCRRRVVPGPTPRDGQWRCSHAGHSYGSPAGSPSRGHVSFTLSSSEPRASRRGLGP
jgi:hypothetical protein